MFEKFKYQLITNKYIFMNYVACCKCDPFRNSCADLVWSVTAYEYRSKWLSITRYAPRWCRCQKYPGCYLQLHFRKVSCHLASTTKKANQTELSRWLAVWNANSNSDLQDRPPLTVILHSYGVPFISAFLFWCLFDSSPLLSGERTHIFTSSDISRFSVEL